jgi:thioredoxin reductase
LFLNDLVEPDDVELALLESRRIGIERVPVLSVGGGADSIELRLRGQRTSAVAAIFLQPLTRLNGPFAEQLGCATEMGRLGPYYRTDANKETTVPGVFACGDVAQAMASIAYAVADGVRAGMFAHRSLVFRPEPAPQPEAALSDSHI